MSRDEVLFLADIVERCDRILAYTRGMDFAAFASDDRTFDAVARNLEGIGEAVKRVSAATRAANPEVAWRQIAGLRDVVIHEYFGVDQEIVWDIAANHIPRLREQVRAILHLGQPHGPPRLRAECLQNDPAARQEDPPWQRA